MKDFMMIFIGADYQELGLSPEQLQERMGKWFAWNEKMQKQGIVKSGDALMPQVKRVSGPNRTITDAPLIEGKELIGGYYIVQAESAEAVVEIAKDYPDKAIEYVKSHLTTAYQSFSDGACSHLPDFRILAIHDRFREENANPRCVR